MSGGGYGGDCRSSLQPGKVAPCSSSGNACSGLYQVTLQNGYTPCTIRTNYLPVTDNVLEYGETVADSAGLGQHGGRGLGDKVSSFL